MVLSSQRTIYGIDLQLSMLIGKEYKPLPNTTLNEKFDIIANKELPPKTYPKLQYYTIGTGGLDILNKLQQFKINTHKVTDGALYNHAPFIMREIDQDLTPLERLPYRFRKKLMINNKEYYAYYLKLIPNIDMKDAIFKITKSADTNKLSLFDTTSDLILNPVPTNKDISDSTLAEYVSKSAKLEFSLTTTELREVTKATEILYGEARSITEIGICTGHDDKDDNGNKEASNVQINYFTHIDVNTVNKVNEERDLMRAINIGGLEPYVN